jgi:hypothetical protein
MERGGQKVATAEEGTAKQEAYAAYRTVAKLAERVLSPAECTQLGLPAPAAPKKAAATRAAKKA